jgi:hypothetical protein
MSGHSWGGIAVCRAIVVLWAFSGMGVSAGAQEEAAEKVSNTCYTENVSASSGTSFSVGVFLNNSDTLVGMQIPVCYRSDDVDLICDSVSFEGSRCRGFSVQFFKIEPTEKIVFLAMLNTGLSPDMPAALLPGRGRVASIWFTAPENSRSGRVVLDSGPGYRFPHERINYGYLFWDPSAVQVVCRYEAGNITLK